MCGCVCRPEYGELARWERHRTHSLPLFAVPEAPKKNKQNLCKNCISIDSIDSQRNGIIRTMHAVVWHRRYTDKEMQRPLGSHKNKQAKILQGTHIEFFFRHSSLFPGHLLHFSRSRCLQLDDDDPTDGAQTQPLKFENCDAKLEIASFAALALTIFLCALQNL